MDAFLCINNKTLRYIRKADVECVYVEYCNRENFDTDTRDYGFYVVFCMGSGETFASQSLYFGINRETAHEVAGDYVKHIVKQLTDESSDDMFGLNK